MAEQETDIIEAKEITTSPLHVTSSHLEEQKNILTEEDMAEQEIDITKSEELMASLHLDHQLLFILAFVLCLSIQLSFGSEGVVVGFVCTLETGMLLLVMVLDLLLVWMYSARSTFGYLRTAAVVLQDYALVISLNRKYIEIALIPFTIFAFIYALASKGSKYQRKDLTKSAKELKEMAMMPQYKGLFTLWKGLTNSAKQLMQMAVLPYLLQLILVVCTQYKGQVEEGNTFIFSNFLLFLGSALCALTVMIASSPPIGVSDGVDEVLSTMQKTCIVMLMLTAHSMATEWLWEDMVFASVSELTSVLAWLTIYCHHPDHMRIIKSVTSHKSGVIVLESFGFITVCLVSLYLEDMIGLRSGFARVLWISSSSSALSYVDVWLLDKWPAGSTTNSSGGLVQLLKFSSLISFWVSVFMLCALAIQYILSSMIAVKFSSLTILSAEQSLFHNGMSFILSSMIAVLIVLYLGQNDMRAGTVSGIDTWRRI